MVRCGVAGVKRLPVRCSSFCSLRREAPRRPSNSPVTTRNSSQKLGSEALSERQMRISAPKLVTAVSFRYRADLQSARLADALSRTRIPLASAGSPAETPTSTEPGTSSGRSPRAVGWIRSGTRRGLTCTVAASRGVIAVPALRALTLSRRGSRPFQQCGHEVRTNRRAAAGIHR
jgi:hypothetical protein